MILTCKWNPALRRAVSKGTYDDPQLARGRCDVPAVVANDRGVERPSDEQIRRLVDRFYARARQDEFIGPVFARALGQSDEAWATHLMRLEAFWSSVMLTSGRYHGDPFSVHLRLPGLTPAMFDRWLALFGQVCAEELPPDLAAAFRERAERIARSIRIGLFERLPTHRPSEPATASGSGP